MNRPLLGLLALALTGAALADPGPPPPLSLTDPDGQGLALERLEVRVAVHGPLALTELEVRFRNPEPYTIEGKFSCLLPPAATLSRFARELDGKWMEGEVVERQRAQQAYSAAIASGSGGSLLQEESGNRFTAKVFPVPGRAAVRLILSYTTVNPLDGAGRRSLTVPLLGLPEIDEFAFRAVCRPLPGERVVLDGWLGTPRTERLGEETIFSESISRQRFAPATNLVFRFEPGAWNPRAIRVRAGDTLMTTLRPVPARTAEESEPDEWVILLDTSASLAEGAEARVAAATALLEEIERGGARRTSIAVLAFDLEVTPLLRFRAGEGRSGELRGQLERRDFLGATDLGEALDFVGRTARKDSRTRAFVLVTDAVPSQGALESAPLLARLGDLPATAKVHVVTVGGAQDAAICRLISERGHGRVVDIPVSFDPAGAAASAVTELRRVPGVDFEVEDPGAEWVHPSRFRDVAPGSELVIFSRLRPGATSALSLAGSDGSVLRPEGEAFEVPGFTPLLEREAIRARIAHLEDQEASAASYDQLEALKRQQVELSVGHRVLCTYTSLLVLDFEEDYERYGIDRKALVEVLVVGPHGVALKGRSQDDLKTMTQAEWDAAKASQKQRNFPAGRDPLIKVRAPADTRRIVALFPWGETKLLQLDPKDATWKARFVIPRWLAHGTYRVVLVLTRGDGRKQRMVLSFGADRRSPEGQGSSRSWRTTDGWQVRLQIQGSRDTDRAVAELPGGVLRPMTRTDEAGAFELVFQLKDPARTSLMVPITLFDGAHNRITVEVEVELQ